MNVIERADDLPGIVTADEMAKSSLAITPRPVTTKRLRPIKLANLLSQPVVCRRDVQILHFFVALRLVHGHIEHAKVQLPEVEQRIIDVLGADQVRNQRVGNLL